MLIDFVKSTLAAVDKDAFAERIYDFKTAQGEHTYPMIAWYVVEEEPLGEDLENVGEAWKAEVQINVFARDAKVCAELANKVRLAFDTAELPEGILSSRAKKVLPVYSDEDETIEYVIRVFIDYKYNLNNKTKTER